MAIYLIKRGPRPDYHRAPFHPVIVCAKKYMAKREAGCTEDRAWLWSRESTKLNGEGFLLERWNGLDIDYGHLVREVGPMPDGTHTAFFHPHKKGEPWSLLDGAVWWDNKKMPPGFEKAGVVYPPDDFTQTRIIDTIFDKTHELIPTPHYWHDLAK
ncbi:hypothetical protein KAR10_04115 [bacterium]|nr:hypothetical protein [bacterium]